MPSPTISDGADLVVAESAQPAVKTQRERLMRARYEAIEAHDQEIVEAMNDGLQELERQWRPTEGGGGYWEITTPKPPGWSDQKYRAACAGQLPRSQVPFSAQAAHERSQSRIRKQGEQQVNMVNIQSVILPAMREMSEAERNSAHIIDVKIGKK